MCPDATKAKRNQKEVQNIFYLSNCCQINRKIIIARLLIIFPVKTSLIGKSVIDKSTTNENVKVIFENWSKDSNLVTDSEICKRPGAHPPARKF